MLRLQADQDRHTGGRESTVPHLLLLLLQQTTAATTKGGVCAHSCPFCGYSFSLQFLDTGCDNCRWMAEEMEHGNLDEFTTSNFSG